MMIFKVFFANNVDPIAKLIGDWMADITIPSIIIRLLLACILGGIVGIERSTKKHAAGLRTYILVCMGSTLAMLTNQFIYQAFGPEKRNLTPNTSW